MISREYGEGLHWSYSPFTETYSGPVKQCQCNEIPVQLFPSSCSSSQQCSSHSLKTEWAFVSVITSAEKMLMMPLVISYALWSAVSVLFVKYAEMPE